MIKIKKIISFLTLSLFSTPQLVNAAAPGNELYSGFSTDYTKEIKAEDLLDLSPLHLFSSKEAEFTDGKGRNLIIGNFINEALNFIFPLAGLVLFIMIVWGGFEMLTGAASKKNLDAGKQRIMAAIVGFILLFCSYWIIQIVEQITGVNILG